MQVFRPCLGKTACIDDGDRCRTCGRSHEEISHTRRLIERIANDTLAAGYANYEEFIAYVARKASAKVRHQGERETIDG